MCWCQCLPFPVDGLRSQPRASLTTQVVPGFAMPAGAAAEVPGWGCLTKEGFGPVLIRLLLRNVSVYAEAEEGSKAGGPSSLPDFCACG